MSGERYLSTEEVLAESRKLGLEVSERTLKYYVSLGLLPKPGKHPSGQVDRRVLFFPAEVLSTLEQIRRLKQEGFSLEQVRQFQAGEALPDLESLARGRDLEGSRLAEKVIRALGSDEVRQAYRDFLALPGEAPDEALRRVGQDFYRRVLASLVGPEEADRTIARTFRGLTPAQWEKRLAPLKKMREAMPKGAPGLREDSLGRTLTSRLEELANQLLAGQPSPTLEGDLSQVARQVETLAAKYSGVPPSNPQKHEIARYMGKALEVYGEAVEWLREAAATQDPQAARQALVRAGRAGQILAHLENMVSEKRELLRLCQEEELRIP